MGFDTYRQVSSCKFDYQEAKPSKDFLEKIDSESFTYSQDLNSKEISKNIEEIFTLGSSKFLFNNLNA